MPWGRLDDTFYDHPKTVEAIRLGGLAAVGLHVMAWSYSNRHGTNGFISDGWVGRRTRLAEALVNARKDPGGEGMWERVEGGYQIHDFLEFNPSAEEVRAAKETQHAVRVSGGVARAAKAERYKGRFAPADTPAGDQQEHQQETSRPPAPSHTQSLALPKELETSPPTPPSGRRRDQSALDMARESVGSELTDTAARLVQVATEKFGWTLTKSRVADEWRLTAELLEHWDEDTILRAIRSRRKLSTMRWLAEAIPRMLDTDAPPDKDRPAWLDEEAGSSMPEEMRRQIQDLAAKKAMP